MNKLPLAKRVQILSMLCEGSSMRSISRVVNVSFNTIDKLLGDAGAGLCRVSRSRGARREEPARAMRRDLELRSRQGEKRPDREGRSGRRWRYLDLDGLDADNKLILSWAVGGRDAEHALTLMDDVRQRLANRVQLTTDGHGPT